MSKKYVIEFDSINDVPDVYIDGKNVSDIKTGGLVSLGVIWNTATVGIDSGNENAMNIQYNEISNFKKENYVDSSIVIHTISENLD